IDSSVIGGQLPANILSAIRLAIRKRKRYMVDSLADARESALAIIPAKKIIASGSPAATRFNDGQARQQAPIKTVVVRFGYKLPGIILSGAMLPLEKSAQSRLAQIRFLIGLCDILFGLHGG